MISRLGAGPGTQKASARRALNKDGASESDDGSSSDGLADRRRLVVLDNRPLLAESLAVALSRDPNISVEMVGPITGAVSSLAGVDTDLVLMSTARDNVSCLRELCSRFPGIRFVVVADSSDHLLMERVLEAGVSGVVDPGTTLDGLVNALCAVRHGQMALPVDVLPSMVQRWRPRRPTAGRGCESESPDGLLSPRETDILELMSLGRGTREIAGELFLSVNTVRSHIQNLFVKLDAHSRVEAVAQARKMGVIGSDARVS